MGQFNSCFTVQYSKCVSSSTKQKTQRKFLVDLFSTWRSCKREGISGKYTGNLFIGSQCREGTTDQCEIMVWLGRLQLLANFTQRYFYSVWREISTFHGRQMRKLNQTLLWQCDGPEVIPVQKLTKPLWLLAEILPFFFFSGGGRWAGFAVT